IPPSSPYFQRLNDDPTVRIRSWVTSWVTNCRRCIRETRNTKMSENKIVAAILTASLGGKGAYDDVPGAVATYRAVLKELKGPDHPAPMRSSEPVPAPKAKKVRGLGAGSSRRL